MRRKLALSHTRGRRAHFRRSLVLSSPDRPTLVLFGPWAGPRRSHERISCPLGIDCLSKSGDVRPNTSSTHATPSVSAVDIASPTQLHRLEYWEMSPLLRAWDPLTGPYGAGPRPKEHQGRPVWRAKYQRATEMSTSATRVGQRQFPSHSGTWLLSLIHI